MYLFPQSNELNVHIGITDDLNSFSVRGKF